MIIRKKPLWKPKRLFKNPAIPTFALVGTIIGSESLTAVFGMGTGMTFQIWSPERTKRLIHPFGPIIIVNDNGLIGS